MTSEVIEVVAGPLVHGGHVLAHDGGRTVLVRGALPGERVRARVTQARKNVVFADVDAVIDVSVDRVQPPCPVAGICGGCDLQHASVASQRTMKAGVIADALRRQGRLAPEEIDALAIEVTALPADGDDDGLGWRTRSHWRTDAEGRPGFYAARSHRVVPVSGCPVAVPELSEQIGLHRRGDADVVGAVGSDGSATVLVNGRAVGSRRTVQQVHGRQWRIDVDGFWQAHVGAPQAYVDTVLELGDPRPGERWWDLYAGAGLFSAFLGEAVGPDGLVSAIEGTAASVRDARRALHDLPQVQIVEADVREWVAEMGLVGTPVDGIVVDPPRTGLGESAAAELATVGAARIVYVACDPVAFARDARVLREHGYALAELRGFDAFPMTHHVELIARFGPDTGTDRPELS